MIDGEWNISWTWGSVPLLSPEPSISGEVSDDDNDDNDLRMLIDVMEQLQAQELEITLPFPSFWNTSVHVKDLHTPHQWKVALQTNLRPTVLPSINRSSESQPLVNLLKSALQKCVRRCLPQNAVRIAKRLIQLE